MMQTFSRLTKQYCFACLTTGILREMFPAGTNKIVIKGLTGLYILLSVLCTVQNISMPAIPSVSEPPQVYSTEPYRKTMLEHIQHLVEEDCTRLLTQAGIGASVRVQLYEENNQIFINTIQLYLKDPSQKDQALSLLTPYQPKEFLVGGEAND